MIADPKIVTISTISCVGRTVIYLYIIYFQLYAIVKISMISCVGRTVIYLYIIYFQLYAIVTISTISCVGRTVIYLYIIYFKPFRSFTRYLLRSIRLVLLVVTYLFILTLCLCGSCLASLLLFTIFPTSRLGWVNLLIVCDLLFVLVLLCVTLCCNGLFWSLLSCFVLYVFSTMYLGLLILFAGFHDWLYWF